MVDQIWSHYLVVMSISWLQEEAVIYLCKVVEGPIRKALYNDEITPGS